LFINYKIVPPAESRIWKAAPVSISGAYFYMPNEAWYNFYVNTSVLNSINPQYIIWYSNPGVLPNSWSDFGQDPTLADRYQLPSTGLNESVTATRSSPFYCQMPSPLRWTWFHWSLPFIEAGVYGVLLIICIVFAIFKKQPLYSKGFTPCLGLISQIMQAVPAAVFTIGTFETISHTLEFLMGTFYFGFLLLSFVIVPLHLFRFVLVLNINKMKGLYRVQILTDRKTGQKQQIETVRWQFRALNIISRWWASAIVFILIPSLWFLFCIIVYGIYSFQTSDGILYVLSTAYLIVSITIIILICLVAVFDFIMNIKSIFTCNKPIKELKGSEMCRKIMMYDYFIEEDPFMFRLEFVFSLLPLFGFYIVFAPLNSYVLLDYVFQAIGNSILQQFLIWYCTIWPLIVTTYWWIRSLISAKQEKEELNSILRDEFGREIFTNFAKQEWSVENISLWDDIQDYLDEKNSTQRQLKATNIFFNYLNGTDSKLEVNLNTSLCQNLKESIDNDPELDDHLFDSILQSVKVNLADTFSRLRLRNDYKSWKRTRDIQKEHMTGQNSIE
jgi:hypothetical protein